MAPLPGSLLAPLVVSILEILAAAAIHWMLRRIGRRLPRLLASRRGRAVGPDVPWERPIQLFLLLPKAALWLAVAWNVSDRFEILMGGREALSKLLGMAARAPLFMMRDRSFSSLDLIGLPAAILAAWMAVSLVTRFFERHLLAPAGVERGARSAIGLITRYLLLGLAAVILLQAWGLDISSLALLASVLGVGIGFGLQNIANNFISGLIVHFERPIQPGDFVKVGDWTGTVERIGPRCTEVRTRDRVSILVPNSRFLETEVVNWSHGDPLTRIQIPIGVAYGSDVARVRAALLEVARSHPDVLADPRPEVDMRGFGASSLDFELEVWIRVPRLQERIWSDLNYRIERTFRRDGISIPFPQHDLHLRSPQIDRLVAALARRHFPEEELAEPNGAGAEMMPMHPHPAPEIGEELDPREWDDARIHTLVGRMRGPEGLAIRDRRHLLASYPRCFVGREAVDWITAEMGLSRGEAVDVGRLLVERGVVHHVLDEHSFEDGHLFYRFRDDD